MVALLILGLLTACSPAPLPVVAITVRDGQPTLVLVTCAGVSSRLGVIVNEPGSDADVMVSWAVSGKASTEIVELAVFGEPPAGWEDEAAAGATGAPGSSASYRVEPLRELVDGVRYSAHGVGTGRSAFVDFTTADLDGLAEWNVLTTDDSGGDRTVPYEEFLRHARDERGPCPDTGSGRPGRRP